MVIRPFELARGNLLYLSCLLYSTYYKLLLISTEIWQANLIRLSFLQIYETVETINQLKINREFFLGFARDPPVRKFLVGHSWMLKEGT